MPYLHAFYKKTTQYFVLKFCQNVKDMCLQILAKYLKNCWSGFSVKSKKPQETRFF